MKIHNKGQVVIPSDMRRKFGMDIGDKVEVTVDKQGIHLYPIVEENVELKGILSDKYEKYGFPSDEEIDSAFAAGLANNESD